MVTRAYMLEQPKAPSAIKQFFDLSVMPVMIDAVGSVEMALEAVAVQGRQRPVAAIGLALGVGCGLGMLLFGRTSPAA